jgi:preprotein translocase subunit SecA
MSILNSVLKVFVGDKSKQDVKAIMPIVKEIKLFEPKIATLSNDELRAKTDEFKSKIQSACAQHEEKIKQLREDINTISDIDQKEELYEEIDQLNDAIYSTTQDVLNAILPEAFAVVKETAKRFVQNTTIRVTANAFDR